MPNLTPSDQAAPAYTGIPYGPDLTQRKIDTREQRITELNGIIAGLEGQIRDHKATISKLDEELGTRQRRLDETDDIFKQLHDTYMAQENELKNQIAGLKNEIAELEPQLIKARTELAQATRNTEILRKNHTTEKEQLDQSLREHTANVTEQKAKLDREILATTQYHRELTGHTQTLTDELHKVEGQITDARRVLSDVTDEHTTEVARHQAIVDDLRAKAIEARKANNANQKAANDQLAETKQHVATELQKLSDKEAIVDAKIAKLRHLEKLEEQANKAKLTGGGLQPQPIQRAPVA